jgi:hypothetical protein
VDAVALGKAKDAGDFLRIDQLFGPDERHLGKRVYS